MIRLFLPNETIEGKIAAAGISHKIKGQVDILIAKKLRAPHLAAVLIGNNGASETYVASKIKNCAEVGYQSSLLRLDESISETDLLKKIEELNNDNSVDGILVQLPLPKHIKEEKVINAISIEKDVDGFHPINIGNWFKAHQHLSRQLPMVLYFYCSIITYQQKENM